MKYLIYVLLASLLVVLLATIINPMGTRIMNNNLSGYIEILANYSIARVDLSTGRSKEVFRNRDNIDIGNYLINFDISPDGKKRILATTGSVDKPPRLLLYGDDKSQKTILEKVFLGYPSFSPDGKFIAYLYTPYAKEKNNWNANNYLFIIKVDGSSDRQISKLSCDVHRPSWFPNGKKITVGSKDLGIYVIDVDNGIDKRIIDFGTAPAVSHDGRKIAYLSKTDPSVRASMVDHMKLSMKEYQDTYMNKKDKQGEMEIAKLFQSYSFFIYDVASGKRKKITNELFVKQSSPLIWSPDDKYILYTDSRLESRTIYALNAETGERQKVTSINGVVMGWRQIAD